MKLDELIEQEGLNNIALKTIISEENLNYLLNEDFEKLSRVKALGFLEILVREYKELDISEIKTNVQLYFEENKPDLDNVIVVSEASSTKSTFPFFKWFVILGILFGGWYFYTEGELDTLLQNVTSKEDLYSDDKALENNRTAEEAKQVSVINDIHEPVSIVAPIEKKIDLEAETLALLDENKTEKETQQDKIVQSVVEESTVSEEKVLSVTTISTITINPTRGMLWFGFINVDTKKKKEFMKQVSTPFDVADGRWILVTGHGFVDVVSELETIEVSDRNKHYFYIDSTELKEISQKEFRTLNGGRGWI